MPFALLLKYRKDIFYVLAILGILGTGLWYRSHLINTGEDRVRDADAKAAAAQKVEDDKILQKAKSSYELELQDLKADSVLHPLPPVQLCITTSGLPEKGVPTNTGSSGGGIQKVPSRDNSVRPNGGPDISGLLDIFAQRADRLSAEARELQAVAH